VIVRWSLAELPEVLAEVGIERPFVIASPRWKSLDLPQVDWWSEVPSDRVEVPVGVDGILAVGGGSAIDTGKFASAQTEKPVVHVPTTYSGAEWTTFYGIRSPDRVIQGGGAGARPVAIVYDVDLTLDLPLDVTAGTALNALAHCAEALYVHGHNPDADEHALAGARLIAEWLPRVVEEPHDRAARTELLRGACHAGAALGGSMLALGHAMAQAIGGRYGLPHGTLNGISLPAALRYNERHAPEAVRRFGEAVGGDPATRVEELAALGGTTRLRDLGVPEADLPELATAAAQRAGNQANPHPATPAEIEQLLRSVW
jgi:alcohol dehydrogenase class IV